MIIAIEPAIFRATKDVPPIPSLPLTYQYQQFEGWVQITPEHLSFNPISRHLLQVVTREKVASEPESLAALYSMTWEKSP